MKTIRVTAGLYKFEYKGVKGNIIRKTGFTNTWWFLIHFKESIPYTTMKDTKVAAVNYIDNISKNK